MAAPTIQYVTERLGALAKPSGTIDREKGIVHGVRIVNVESGNGRRYPAAVLRACVAAYEGRGVNVGHRKNPHDFDDPVIKFGQLRNVRTVVEGGLEADLHLNPKHSFAEPFLWACENSPSLYALSHHAMVKWANKPAADGARVAESILGVASVDIVSVGGTTSGVFESDQPGAKTVDPKEIAASLADQAAVETFLKDLLAALPQSVNAMAALEAVMGGMAEQVPTDPLAATESLRRRGRVGQWAAEQLATFFAEKKHAERRKWATDLCTAEGLHASLVTESFTGLLMKCGSDVEAKEAIADRKKLAPVNQRGGEGGAGAKTTTQGSGSGKPLKDVVAELDFS